MPLSKGIGISGFDNVCQVEVTNPMEEPTMKKTRLSTVLSVAVLAFSILLSACGGEATPTSTTAGSGGSAGQATPTAATGGSTGSASDPVAALKALETQVYSTG